MALKLPKNQIATSKYTSGGEYVTDKEYKNYQGYYYELNNKVPSQDVIDKRYLTLDPTTS